MLDGPLAECQELARFDGEIPELCRRRGERLARVRVVERDRFRVGLGGGALRAQPPPHVDLPRYAEKGGRAVERPVIEVLGAGCAELHADPWQ